MVLICSFSRACAWEYHPIPPSNSDLPLQHPKFLAPVCLPSHYSTTSFETVGYLEGTIKSFLASLHPGNFVKIIMYFVHLYGRRLPTHLGPTGCAASIYFNSYKCCIVRSLTQLTLKNTERLSLILAEKINWAVFFQHLTLKSHNVENVSELIYYLPFTASCMNLKTSPLQVQFLLGSCLDSPMV